MSRYALIGLCGALVAFLAIIGGVELRQVRALERIADLPTPKTPDECARVATMSPMPAFQKSCTSTASRVEPSSGAVGYAGIWVWNGTVSGGGGNSTPVYFGDANVTATNGMPLCSAATCPKVDQDWATSGLYCITLAGTSATVTAQIARP